LKPKKGGRIVYFGAERVGLACLQRLVDSGKTVEAVFTADDDLRSSIADWAPFDQYTREQGLPLFKVKSCRGPEVARQVAQLRPDLICVISWSMIMPPAILGLPPRGTLAIHYSMLPQRRGGAPLNWALIDGLSSSGITLYYMDEGIDTGDIIGRQSFGIGESDTAKDLLDKIVILAPDLLEHHIDAVLDGSARRTKQDEAESSYTPRRRPEDSLIDWSKSDPELYNFIRALSPPYPCAYTCVGERKLLVPAARMVDGRLHVEAYLE
jgi:methionyl-tRNA formyltransferase